MRPTLLASLLVLPLALGLADPSAAKKKNKKPPACPPASYVLDVAEPLGPAGIPGFPDVIEVDGEGNVLVSSSCPAVPGKVKGSKKGDKVSAKWGKEVCDQLGGKVKLKAKLDPSCTTLTGKFKAKKHKVKFTATRPPSVTPVLEPERRNAATIGREGGSVSAEGSNGVVYTLEIPEFALLGDTEVALTPVASIPDLPFSGGLAGSVEFEPDGLELLRMATLRIEVPGGFVPPEGTRLVGFGSQSGQSFHARFAADDAGTIVVPISHFSGGGAGAATPEELDARPALSPVRERFISTVVSLAEDPEAYGTYIVDFFDLELDLYLAAAAESDHALDQTVELLLDWLFFGFDAAFAPEYDRVASGAADRLEDALALAAAALGAAIDRANTACQIDGAESDLDEAREALRWQRVAEGIFAAIDRSGDLELVFLDRETVLFDLCVQVVISEVSFPDQPLVGEASILRVVATSTLPAITAIVVTAIPIAGLFETLPISEVVTDGVFEATFTTVETGAIEIDVQVCLAVAGLEEVCDVASVVRGLILEPSSAVLAAGDSQQFSAEVFGLPIANPVWTATGGSITETGLYTAGSVTGPFEVVVSSADDPGFEAIAPITIVPSGFSRRSELRIGSPPEQFFEGLGESNLALPGMTEQSNVALGGAGQPVLSAIGAASVFPQSLGGGQASFALSFTTDRVLDYAIDVTGQTSGQASGFMAWCPGGDCVNRDGEFTESGLLEPGVHSFRVVTIACGGAVSALASRGACSGPGTGVYGFSLVLTELEP